MHQHTCRIPLFVSLALLAPLASCATPREVVVNAGPPGQVLRCAWSTPVPPADRFRVGPSGGTLRNAGNELRIPRDAVSDTIEVTFGVIGGDTVGIRLLTDGLPDNRFEKDVELVVNMRNCSLPGGSWAVWRIREGSAPQALRTRFRGNRAHTWIREHSGFIIASRAL